MKFVKMTALALVLAAGAVPTFAQDKKDDKGAEAPVEKYVPQSHSTRLSGVFGETVALAGVRWPPRGKDAGSRDSGDYRGD